MTLLKDFYHVIQPLDSELFLSIVKSAYSYMYVQFPTLLSETNFVRDETYAETAGQDERST